MRSRRLRPSSVPASGRSLWRGHLAPSPLPSLLIPHPRLPPRGGSREVESLWSPNPPPASTAIESVHPADPPRLSHPRLCPRFSLACQRGHFFKAQLNATSSKKPSRLPSLPRSVLVPAIILVRETRVQGTLLSPRDSPQGALGSSRIPAPAPAPTAGRRGLTCAQSQAEPQSRTRAPHGAI